ncbi:MAG: PrsW family intramembrane metalloprotease [Firmicutes bacterium]|nr:PrsW family intramembrane metalloprotease [Bacillota bacterium]
MHTWVLLLVSFGPGLLWLLYFYRLDRGQPEPKALVLRAFLFGSLAVFPAGLLELPFRSWVSHPSLLGFLMIGVIEEGAKFLAARTATRHQPAFDELTDGIFYMASTGLGFAALENLLYVYVFGLQVGVARAFVATLAHASFSGLVGAYWGEAVFGGGRPHLWRGFLMAAAAHGLYDAILSFGFSPLWALLLVYLIYRWVVSRLAAFRAMMQR